jgi:hypothetical protein
MPGRGQAKEGPGHLPLAMHCCTHACSLAQGTAAYRLLTEPEHNRIRPAGERDAEGRAASDPIMTHSGMDFRCGPGWGGLEVPSSSAR